MNKTTGLRQRSKRAKQLIIAGVMATAVGGFGVAITLPANAASGSFCATKACKGTPPPDDKKGAPDKVGLQRKNFGLTGEGFSRREARFDLNNECAGFQGKIIRITKEYTESDEDGDIFFADGVCLVDENQLR